MKRLLIFLLLTVSSAHGEVFTWTDSKGTTHYTNSVYEIPARYRAKAKTLNLGTEPQMDRGGTSQPAPQLPLSVVPETVQNQKPGQVQTKGRRARPRTEAVDE